MINVIDFFKYQWEGVPATWDFIAKILKSWKRSKKPQSLIDLIVNGLEELFHINILIY